MLDNSIISQVDNLIVTAKTVKTIMQKPEKKPSEWLALGALIGQLNKQVIDTARMMDTASSLAEVKEFNELYKIHFPAS